MFNLIYLDPLTGLPTSGSSLNENYMHSPPDTSYPQGGGAGWLSDPKVNVFLRIAQAFHCTIINMKPLTDSLILQYYVSKNVVTASGNRIQCTYGACLRKCCNCFR